VANAVFTDDELKEAYIELSATLGSVNSKAAETARTTFRGRELAAFW